MASEMKRDAVLKIRKRDRRGRPREAFGAYTTWTEYQVVSGRKIIKRCDTREQAEAALLAARSESQ